MAISHYYWHLVVNNGNFTLLLTSSGQECLFHIPTDTLWSRMAISHCYWHLVVKNGNFTILLTSSGEEWQLADLLLDLPADLPPKMHHGIYIMECICQPFWILQEKVGIPFYLSIIRIVNSQLALYSHVRCIPPDTPNNPETLPKHCLHDNYKFQLWELIFARCNR